MKKENFTKEVVRFEISIEPEPISIESTLSFEETGADYSEYIEKVLNDNGANPWLWCSVKVTAGWFELEGYSYLGACAYQSEEDFKNGGYFEQMKDEAFEQLKEKVERLTSHYNLLTANY